MPRRVKFLGWGDNPNAKGIPVVLGKKIMEALASPHYAYRVVALDYEHNTLPGTPEFEKTAEPRKVAAYGRVEVVENDGAYLNIESYTPSGEENAANYCDVSAGVYRDENGEVIAIHSVALCRNGAVEGMEFKQVALSVAAPVEQPEKAEGKMDKAKLIALLKLPETATEEEIQAALEALVKKGEEPPDGEEKPPANADDADGKKPDVKKADGMSAALDYTKLADELQKRDLVKKARAEGKAVALSDSALGAMTPADVETYLAGLSATVPVSPKTPKKVDEPRLDARPDGLSDNDRKIFAAMGLTEEDAKVLNPASKK